MQGWLLRWILNIAAIIVTAAILPAFEVTPWGAIVGSIFLGIINAIIRPVLLLLTLPLNIVSLGLFTFVINGLMIWVTAVTIQGFEINGFGWAILTAIILSMVSFIISYLIKDKSFKF